MDETGLSLRTPTTTNRESPNAPPMLRLDSVDKQYQTDLKGQAPVTAISNLSIDVMRGEFLAIIGPSGCGKSTLLRLVEGLDSPSSGKVSIGGEPINGPHPDIGVVFQEDSTLPWLSARQNVVFALKHRGYPKNEWVPRADSMLELVGLTGFEGHYPRQLSGGMKQRVALARALSTDPKLLLMDEPFGALDEQTRLHLGDELLRIWRSTSSTILFVTHSLTEAVTLATRIIVLTERPARIKAVLDNRDVGSVSSESMGSKLFVQRTAKLWDLLRDAETT